MDVKAIKNQIIARKPQPFYIFTGEEWAVQRIYIDQIAEVSGREKRFVDSISDIFSKLRSKSFIQKAFVYVVRDDKDILSNEKLQDSLPDVLGDNILILLLTSVDKRTKFYKKYSKDICEFERLKPQVLAKYIQQEIALSKENTEKLMEVCEYDYGRCLLEIDKIKQWVVGYGEDKQEQMPEDGGLLRLLNDGTIYRPPKDAIFDFVDAVLRRKVKSCFNLLYQSYAVGEAALVLLSVLYNNAKQVLQVQTCNSNDVEKSTGLTTWQIKCARDKQGRYSNEELERMLRVIHKCETDIKSGKMEGSVAVEFVLVHVL